MTAARLSTRESELRRFSEILEATPDLVAMVDTSGGAGMFKGNELERLYRDVRCGGFHPANSALVHELTGKTALGILGEEPRY